MVRSPDELVSRERNPSQTGGKLGLEAGGEEKRTAGDVSPEAVASAAPTEAVDPGRWRWLKRGLIPDQPDSYCNPNDSLLVLDGKGREGFMLLGKNKSKKSKARPLSSRAPGSDVVTEESLWLQGGRQ